MVVGLGVAPLEVCRLGGSTAADPRLSNFLPLSLLLADIMSDIFALEAWVASLFPTISHSLLLSLFAALLFLLTQPKVRN